jgi:hypothetical protein
MISLAEARTRALSLPGVEEKSHFEQPDFRVKKKIFAVLHPVRNIIMVKLSVQDQDIICSFDKEIIFPVPGGWGNRGCTFIRLDKINKRMFSAALFTAWKTVAGKKMADDHFPGK